MKTTLTIEQSQKLIELGVDTKLASKKKFVPIHPEVLKGNAEYAKPWGWFPKFRLEDILSILPKEMNFNGVRVSLQMYQHLAGYWIASYVAYSGNKLIHQNPLCAEKELIDALYQLAIWCLENNHIKNEKK